jgi:putative oxidoreductase
MKALCDSTKEYGPLIGRVLMSLIFLTSAYGKITGFDATLAAMAAKGMPAPQVLLVCALAIELACGTLLVLGWHTRLAALGLIVFLVPATLYFHNYWTYPPGEVRNQRNHYMKNVTILGALIFVAGMGAGPLSIDARRRKSKQRA